jgi:hypothetical protein
MGHMRNATIFWSGKSKRRGIFVILMKDSTKINLKEWDVKLVWIYLQQDRDWWWNLMNIITDVRI